MRMKNPLHPGLSVRYDCLEPLGLSVADGAEALGVTRQAMNNLVRGRAGISAEMAIRLEKAFGGGAETWLRLQAAYDLGVQLLDDVARRLDAHDAIARETGISERATLYSSTEYKKVRMLYFTDAFREWEREHAGVVVGGLCALIGVRMVAGPPLGSPEDTTVRMCMEDRPV